MELKVGDKVRHLGGGWLATVTEVHPLQETIRIQGVGHNRAYDAEYSVTIFEKVEDE
jgi:hypothetical protein